jgi:hypothetical protein
MPLFTIPLFGDVQSQSGPDKNVSSRVGLGVQLEFGTSTALVYHEGSSHKVQYGCRF